MKWIVRLAVLLLVLAAIGGGYWVYRTQFTASAQSSSSGQTYTQVVQVKQGSLSSMVSVVGELAAVQSEDLAFTRMSGTAKLAKLNVAAGNTVKAGQVLASIDPASYQQALDQAQSDLAASQKTLSDLKEPATALELAQSDLAIAQADYDLQAAQNALDELVSPDFASLNSAVADAQSALAKAQANLVAQQQDTSAKQELDNLYAAEATPSADYNRLSAETYSDEKTQDQLALTYNQMMDAQDARVTYETQQKSNLLSAQQAVRTAEKTLADAQKALATARAGGDPVELAHARLAVQTAQAAQLKAKDDRATLEAGADPTELATAQADVDKKQLAVTDAQAALDGAQLKASFDGTVLKTNVAAGDDVTASTVVLTVANLKGLQVVASVDETTIKRIAAGQKATITFDAFPGQTFTGVVEAVPLQGSLQNDVMVYEVPLSLEGAEQIALLVGMTANVQVQVAAVENALLVPTMALQKVNGLYQVEVVNSSDPQGAPVAVPVEVGLSDGTYTQVTKGLNVGDRVVVQMSTTTGSSNNNNRRGGQFFIQGGGGPPPGR